MTQAAQTQASDASFDGARSLIQFWNQKPVEPQQHAYAAYAYAYE